jgi:SAM-dependent methyltransferase
MSLSINDWLHSSRGRALREAEALLLREALDDCFGWEMLQIGLWGGERELIAAARTRRQTVISSTVCQGADVLSRLTQLPVASDSVDAVLLPHTLEFETDPYAVLREVDRVLTGEGKLLVLGFHPWSLWGLRAKATRGGWPPQLRRLLSERRLRDWLVLLGYEVTETRRYLYDAPWGEPATAARSLHRSWFNPLPAGAYLMKARKRIYALPPLRLRLRERTQLIGGLVKPTAQRDG